LLTLEKAKNTPIGKKIVEKGLVSKFRTPHTMLAVFLLQVMKRKMEEEKFFLPYYDLL